MTVRRSDGPTVTARIEREVRNLDEPTLKWGNEKLLSVTAEQIGTATQKFIIEVRKGICGPKP